jgi:type II secretory pathway component GspD/PulD (secretin)
LNGFVAAGNAFNALISALQSTDRFHVVSSPSITTTNNKKATIASGEEIAVPGTIEGGFTGASASTDGLVTQTSIQYKTVALQLQVMPTINSDHEVTLEIVQKIDQQAGSDVIDNNTIPRIATRVLQTTVSVQNNATVVLGGLIKESVDHSLSGIPGLMKLPLLGPLFRKTTVDKQRTELVILLRPEVTVGPIEDTRIREKEMEYLNLEPDLESTLYPPNKRQKVTPEIFSRHTGVNLRDSDALDMTPLK